jgi:hypothetical protein
VWHLCDVHHSLRLLLSRPPRLLAVVGGLQRRADCREGNAMPSRRILR